MVMTIFWGGRGEISAVIFRYKFLGLFFCQATRPLYFQIQRDFRHAYRQLTLDNTQPIQGRMNEKLGEWSRGP